MILVTSSATLTVSKEPIGNIVSEILPNANSSKSSRKHYASPGNSTSSSVEIMSPMNVKHTVVIAMGG